MNKFEKILRITSSRVVLACAVITLAWVFVFTAYIMSRFLNLGWMFVEEFTGYWMVLIAYMPLAYALMTDTHIRIEVMSSRLPKKARSILEVCTDTIALILVAYLLGRSIEWLLQGIEYETRSSTASNIPLWPIYLLIPIGLTLFGLMLAVKISHGVTRLMRTGGRGEEGRSKLVS